MTQFKKTESDFDKASLVQLSMAVISILVILSLWVLLNSIHIQ